MRVLILILLVLLSAPSAWGAAITSAQSGNWSATSTWTGGVIPDPAADTVTIASGHTVTLSDTRSIPATTVEGALVQGAGVTTTLAGALTIGNGASKDGTFTFGAGATLAQGANNVVLANCRINSNASSGSWAIVTGSGNWQTHATITSPYQDFALSYISFQTTGSLSFALAHTTGAFTSGGFSSQHCAYVGQSAITIGTAGVTQAAVHYDIDYNDFRNTGHILIRGNTPTTGRNNTRYNTFSNTTLKSFIPNRLNAVLTGNVLYNVDQGVNSGSASYGGHNIGGNFYAFPSSAASGSSMVYNSSSYAANTISGNYFYSPYANAHVVQGTGNGSGAGTQQITNNIFESPFNFDGSNLIPIANQLQNITGNLLIGSGSLATAYASVTTPGVTVSNNTAYITSTSADNFGIIYSVEGASVVTGPKHISSNLIQYAQGLSPTGSACRSTSAGALVDFSDYNDFAGFATGNRYANITLSNTPAYDLNASTAFTDPSRSLAAWGAIVGADGTSAGAITKLLASNGYNDTSKTQSDAASGAAVSALVAWVRSGFTPTSAALKGTGEGGGDIGAVAVQVASSFAINGQRYATWNGRTLATWNGAAQ